MQEHLELVDIIHRSLRDKGDVRPLVKYLRMDESVLDCGVGEERAAATKIANYLRQMGSHDIATLLRGGEGVAYEEIVFEVGEKLRAKVKRSKSVEENEEQILLKLFEDSLERMTEDEKRAILHSIGINEVNIPFGPLGAAAVQNLLRQFGGFSVYKTTVVVANLVSRSLLGSGLSFATNVTLTRAVGAILGPVGWIATGLWLVHDLAGPAFRKTVPAVIHVALLRTILMKRITIGVVGAGSAGKDALMHAVFAIDSKIDPVAGSTETALTYPLNKSGSACIVNYPGFDDYRKEVNKYTDDYLYHTDVFVMVVDISRGILDADAKILEKIKTFGRPIMICLNKVDLPRTKEDLAKLETAARARLPGYRLIKTAFDPDPRLGLGMMIGIQDVYDWIRSELQKDGKSVDADNFPPPRAC